MTRWFIYVPRNSRENFRLGRSKATWGSIKETALADLAPGDEVVFVHNIAATEPPPRGFPRVPLEQFRGVANILLRTRVVGEPFQDPTPLWPDGSYPYRFRFEELQAADNADVDESAFTDPERNAIRLSAVKQGAPQAALSLSKTPKPFVVGQVYNRRHEIHEVYDGQRQGGMATPAAHPLIFLFTSENGAEHGYQDEFKADGTFWYTGEGQVGDQQFTKCNKALRDHVDDGKTVHLFEEFETGLVRYMGQFEYLDHRFQIRPDREGAQRKAIIFELGQVEIAGSPPPTDTKQANKEPSDRHLNSKSLDELRKLAMMSAPQQPTKEQRRYTVRMRSAAVKAYVLKRADGTCEGCQMPAPFTTRKGRPYLEPHHTTRIADGGPDRPAHVIALCPNCHRRAHHADDGDAYNEILKTWLVANENDELPHGC